MTAQADQPDTRQISPLRQRMLEDMAMHGLRDATQRDYLRFIRSFAAFLQTESGVQPPTINCSVSALRFFFTVTLDRPDLSRRLVLVRHPRRLPTVLSGKEVGQLLEAAPGPKYRAALHRIQGVPGSVALRPVIQRPLRAAPKRTSRRDCASIIAVQTRRYKVRDAALTGAGDSTACELPK